jgi:ribosome-binding protein aMBF1 (putative translation factor)
MAKGKKTEGTVREIFKSEFEDREFRIFYEEEMARNEIALAIMTARKAAGLTQKELAEKVETKQSVIARLESGNDKRNTSLPLLARIAAATGRHLVLEIVKN